jgi:hypothetical protein
LSIHSLIYSFDYVYFVGLIGKLMDKKIFLSVENEGLRQRITTLKTALKLMRRNFDSANKKLRALTREHSKCSEKRKIMFLHR